MSSAYVTWMPDDFSNAARVGYSVPSSFWSRYCVQLAQRTSLSLSDVSLAGSVDCDCAPVPHAASSAPAPTVPTAPSRKDRRPRSVDRPRLRAAWATSARMRGSDGTGRRWEVMGLLRWQCWPPDDTV